MTNPPQPMQPPLPWGFWATSAFAILIAAAFSLTQVVVLSVMAAVGAFSDQPPELPDLLKELQYNGFFIAVATCASAVIGSAMIFLFAWLKKGLAVKTYLRMRLPSTGQVLAWLGYTLGLVLLVELLTVLIGRPVVNDFMHNMYSSARYPVLLLVALVAAAPVFEELFFRGFLLEGWRNSFMGPYAAVVVTALLWAAIHMQYDLFEMAIIFVLGLFLGLARLRTGSTTMTIMLHGLINLAAFVEVSVYQHFA